MNPESGGPNISLELGKEYPPNGEDDALLKLRALHLKVHKVSPGAKFRGEHPKQHAGVWGTFEIADNIPIEFKVGIFQQPQALRVFIRFSNGRSFDDRDPNIRGIAIKVFTANSSPEFPLNQDFILADHPTFFARDVQDVYDFLLASSAGASPDKLVAMFPKLLGYTKIAKGSPLSLSYWSQTPYQLGSCAVKYFLEPSHEQNQLSHMPQKTENWLREAMIEQLTRLKLGGEFTFYIQPQTDAYAMPIEDPTIEWTSPPIRLATISIPPQEFDSPEHVLLAEKSTWSPWHHLAHHRPLGGINRARKLIYAESQKLREAGSE